MEAVQETSHKIPGKDSGNGIRILSVESIKTKPSGETLVTDDTNGQHILCAEPVCIKSEPSEEFTLVVEKNDQQIFRAESVKTESPEGSNLVDKINNSHIQFAETTQNWPCRQKNLDLASVELPGNPAAERVLHVIKTEHLSSHDHFVLCKSEGSEETQTMLGDRQVDLHETVKTEQTDVIEEICVIIKTEPIDLHGETESADASKHEFVREDNHSCQSGDGTPHFSQTDRHPLSLDTMRSTKTGNSENLPVMLVGNPRNYKDISRGNQGNLASIPMGNLGKGSDTLKMSSENLHGKPGGNINADDSSLSSVVSLAYEETNPTLADLGQSVADNQSFLDFLKTSSFEEVEESVICQEDLEELQRSYKLRLNSGKKCIRRGAKISSNDSETKRGFDMSDIPLQGGRKSDCGKKRYQTAKYQPVVRLERLENGFITCKSLECLASEIPGIRKQGCLDDKVKTKITKEAIQTSLSTNSVESPLTKSCRKTSSKSHFSSPHKRVPRTCKICGLTLTRGYGLLLHMRTHTGERPYSCDKCPRTFTCLSSLNSHHKLHTGEKPYACKICHKRYVYSFQLRAHMGSHTRPYSCKICKKRFPSLGGLRGHGVVHSGNRKKPFKCEVCHKALVSNVALKQHSLIHTGERPHSCTICKKTFTLRVNLKHHYKIHTGEKPYACGLCPRRFASSSHLKRHQVTHTKEKPFSCEICQKRFSSRDIVRSHMLSHSDERPHSCELCQKSYKTPSALKAHKTSHTDERPHKCEVCQKHFKKKGNLKMHMQIHRGDRPFICKVCHKGYKTVGNLRVHMVSHKVERPYVCEICHKSYKTMCSLKSHVASHEGKRPYACKTCGKRFVTPAYLTQHELLHSGEKPYVCKICKRSYATPQYLRRHILKTNHE